MNIFLILIFCFLNSFDAAEYSLKRKASTSEIDFFEVSSDVSIEDSSVSGEALTKFVPEKRAKVEHKSPFKILPTVLVGLIASYLRNPYKSLPLVSKHLSGIMKEFPPGIMLASRSSNAYLKALKPSREAARLISLDESFLNEKFAYIFTPGSVFKPESPETVEIAALIASNYPAGLVPLLSYLKEKKMYQGIVRLLKVLPNFTVDFEEPEEFIECLWDVLKTNPEDLMVLKRASQFKSKFFIALAALPVSHDTFQFFLAGELTAIPPAIVLTAVGFSCGLDGSVAELSAADKELIHQRNSLIIESTACENQELIQWAHLCNDLRYTEKADTPINKSLLKTLQEQAGLSLLHFWGSKFIYLIYQETLINISILGKYRNIFSQMLKHNNYSPSSPELRKYLQKYPEFIKTLSPTTIKRIFGIKDQVFLLENGAISESDISRITNVYERIRVSAGVMSSPVFRMTLLTLFAEHSFNIATLITRIAKNSKDPAPIIFDILDTFKDIEFLPDELPKIAAALGNPKHIKSLLEPENEEFLTFPSQKFYVLVDEDNFREILDMAEVLKAPRFRQFRKLFCIKWLAVFNRLHLHPDEIINFFGIFEVKIGNFELNEVNVVSYTTAREVIQKDSRELFKYPASLSPFIDYFLVSLATQIFHGEDMRSGRFRTDRQNPFVLKSFGIYKLWMDRNFNSFLRGAPFMVLNALVTKLSPVFIKKLILKPKKNVNVIRDVLKSVLSKNPVIEISILNVSELRKFFHEALPYLHTHFHGSMKLKARIHWDQVIMDARGNIVNYEIILTVINQDELNWLQTLNPMHQEVAAFLYYVANSGPHELIQSNRALLNNFMVL